ncbi:hypothetical protein DI487_10450 [Flavobacterium sediminis]|uniref:Uncharacterized protein n=2 Tax=Flavobacterium TaxID=237 RepID=A0A2U8QVJ8_9FLAO|nr:hypothetical protein [Flavobacterium sediminis]AWM14230.1 hypothetical protein DI487_10450 [Flavobacterium sediminis]
MIYFNGNQPYRKEVTQYPGETYETTWVEETFFDNNVNPFNSVIGLSEIEIACPIVNVGYQGISNNATEVKIDGVTDWVIVLAYNANNMPDTEDFTDPSNPEYNSTSQYIYN